MPNLNGMPQPHPCRTFRALNDVFNCQDLLRTIFSHLDVPNRIRASSCCKLFHSVDMYDEVELDLQRTGALPWLAKRAPGIRSLSVACARLPPHQLHSMESWCGLGAALALSHRLTTLALFITASLGPSAPDQIFPTWQAHPTPDLPQATWAAIKQLPCLGAFATASTIAVDYLPTSLEVLQIGSSCHCSPSSLTVSGFGSLTRLSRLSELSVFDHRGACTYPTAEDAAAVSSRLHEINQGNEYLTKRMSYKREVADLLTVTCTLPALTSLELSSPWIETWPEMKLHNLVLDVCGDDLPKSFKLEAPCEFRLTIGLGILHDPHSVASFGTLVELFLQDSGYFIDEGEFDVSPLGICKHLRSLTLGSLRHWPMGLEGLPATLQYFHLYPLSMANYDYPDDGAFEIPGSWVRLRTLKLRMEGFFRVRLPILPMLEVLHVESTGVVDVLVHHEGPTPRSVEAFVSSVTSLIFIHRGSRQFSPGVQAIVSGCKQKGLQCSGVDLVYSAPDEQNLPETYTAIFSDALPDCTVKELLYRNGSHYQRLLLQNAEVWSGENPPPFLTGIRVTVNPPPMPTLQTVTKCADLCGRGLLDHCLGREE